MTDKEFLNSCVAERMQMHYSAHKEGMAEGETNILLSLEREYSQVLGALPDAARTTIVAFVKSLTSGAADNEAFFYMKGVKDGLLLYKALTGW